MSHSEFRSLLAELWIKELEVAELEEDQTFFDLGGTSRGAVSVADELQTKAAVELSLADLAHQTFEEIVDQYSAA